MQIRPIGFKFSFVILATTALAFVSATTFAGTQQTQTKAKKPKSKSHQIAIDFAKGSQVRVAGEYEYEGSVIVIPEAN